MKIDWKVAELYGILVGDGHIHKYNNSIFVVSSSEESSYLKNRVIPLFEVLFNKTPYFARRRDRNAFYIQIYSKDIVNFFVNELAMNRGNKENLRLSKNIMSNKILIRSFLRGVFDTDGCIKFSKQAKKINYYPRIQLAFQNTSLVDDIKLMLEKLDFNYGEWHQDNFGGISYIQISGKENLEKWVNEIGSANSVQASKFLFWRKFGYFKPKSTLKERLKALDIKSNPILIDNKLALDSPMEDAIIKW